MNKWSPVPVLVVLSLLTLRPSLALGAEIEVNSEKIVELLDKYSDFPASLVKIEGKYRSFEGDDPQKVRTDAVVRTTIDPNNVARIRVELSPYIMRADAPGGYLQRDMTIVGTGEKWMTRVERVGEPGKAITFRELYIEAKRPTFLGDERENCVSGMDLLPQTVRVFYDYRISQAIEYITTGAIKGSITQNGNQMEIELKDHCTESKLTLCVSGERISLLRLIRMMNTCADNNMIYTLIYNFEGTVDLTGTKLQLPKKISRELYINDKMASCSEFVATDATVVDEKPDSVFSINVPDATYVFDRVRNISFRTGPNRNEIINTIRLIDSKE